MNVGCETPVLANTSAELAIIDVELIHTCPSLNDEDRSRWSKVVDPNVVFLKLCFWSRGSWSQRRQNPPRPCAELIEYLLRIHAGDTCWIMRRRIRNVQPHSGSAFLPEESRDRLAIRRFLKLTHAGSVDPGAGTINSRAWDVVRIIQIYTTLKNYISYHMIKIQTWRGINRVFLKL